MVAPSDAATQVPLNVELRVAYGGAAPGSSTAPTLETGAGVLVPTIWQSAAPRLNASYSEDRSEYWVGKAAVLLQPNAVYRLRHALRDCASESDGGVYLGCGLCTSSVGETIVTFTTGSAPIETLVQSPAVGTPRLAFRDRQTDGAACGPYDSCRYEVSAVTHTPDQVLRIVHDDGTLVRDKESEHPLLIAVHREGSNGYSRSADIAQFGPTRYRLYAVDAQGQRSAAVEIVVPACAAEPMPDLDEPPASGGCSLLVGESRRYTPLGILLCAAALWRGLRRSRVPED